MSIAGARAAGRPGVGDHGGVASETTSVHSPAAPVAEAVGPVARPKKPKVKTARDMVLSMAVISAVAFAVFLVVPNEPPAGGPASVEYAVAAETAARSAPYPLLAPEGLGPAWRASYVRYLPEGGSGATWRLGFVTPDEEYAGLAQADGDPGRFVAEMTQGAEDTGETRRIGGRDWARYAGDTYDALVLTAPGATTVVMGTTSPDRLTELAAALEPALPGATDDRS